MGSADLPRSRFTAPWLWTVLIGTLAFVTSFALSSRPALYLALPLVLGYLLIVFLRPLIGLCTLTILTFALLPNFSLYGPLTLRIAIVLITGLAFLANLAIKGTMKAHFAVLKDHSFLLLVLYTGLVTISCFTNNSGWDSPYLMLNNLFVFFLVSALIADTTSLRIFCYAVFLGCLGVTIAGWMVFLQYPVFSYPIRNLDGPYGKEIVMALHSLIGTCIGVALYKAGTSFLEKALITFGIFLTGAMSLSAASRGVTVAALAILLYLAAKQFGRARWFPFLGALGAIVIITFAFEPLFEFFQESSQIAMNVNTAAELSSGRVYLYRAALHLFPKYPVFGIGWDQFKTEWFSAMPAPLITQTGVPVFNVHSSYLQVLVELGLVGFSVYAAWTYFYLRRAFRLIGSRKYFSDWSYKFLYFCHAGVLAAIVSLLLHSVVDNQGRGHDRGHIILVSLLFVCQRLASEYIAKARNSSIDSP